MFGHRKDPCGLHRVNPLFSLSIFAALSSGFTFVVSGGNAVVLSMPPCLSSDVSADSAGLFGSSTDDFGFSVSACMNHHHHFFKES